MGKFDKQYKRFASGSMTLGKIAKIVALLSLAGIMVFWASSLVNILKGHKNEDCTGSLKSEKNKVEGLTDKNAGLNAHITSLNVKIQDLQKNIAEIKANLPPKETTIVLYSQRLCKGEKIEISSSKLQQADVQSYKWSNGQQLNTNNIKSANTLRGDLEVDLYEETGADRYFATVYPFDGCVPIYDWPPLRSLKFKTGSLQPKKGADALQRKDADYRIIYSAESSTYMGYQSQTSYYSFLTSNQGKATYTRLVTCEKEDDLMDVIPSWFGKRHPFSKRYSPLNKPDVITKYFESSAAPTEEVIVILDPDNWLVKSVEPFTKQVKKGTCLGEPAFYVGNAGINALWKEVCEENCDATPAHQGIPYMIHRDDMKVVAPLWRMYVLKLKERFDADASFLAKYSKYGIQPDWCAEMFGWNYATTHAGLIQKVQWGMQLRDVATRVSDSEWNKIPMIHVGRAWWPPSYKPGAKWWHTEGKEFSHYGAQVWCKCNNTANDIVPWPLPPGKIDHVSNATLSLMHGAREKWGKLPFNKWRHSGTDGYSFAMN